MSPSSLPFLRRQFFRRGSAAARTSFLLSALLAVLVAGCADADGPARSGSGESKPTASARPAASFPPSPPAASGCTGRPLDQRDIQHPKLGPVRVFLVQRPASVSRPAGCVAAVTGSGRALAPVDVDANWSMEDPLRFAAPATDSTKNTFVIYNPGRYDGVLVLVPTADGFADIGWRSADDHYSGGRFAFYFARPAGPGKDGAYAIVQSIKGCDPSCAEGATAQVTLRWDGHDYLPTG
ncbi:hypothetical protein [Streptomyces clavifer]|uniref:hypothetical protein n=1 Tax=Streptomyces clavifer TaxID=68188 RepID=UPI0037FB6760